MFSECHVSGNEGNIVNIMNYFSCTGQCMHRHRRKYEDARVKEDSGFGRNIDVRTLAYGWPLICRP